MNSNDFRRLRKTSTLLSEYRDRYLKEGDVGTSAKFAKMIELLGEVISSEKADMNSQRIDEAT